MNIFHWANMLSLNKKKWQLLHRDEGASILEVLFANRQIEDSETFLHPNFDTGLYNPFLMQDMQKAVDLTRQIQQDNLRVMIVGDYDADGITGTALLYETFKALGIQRVICRLPHRIHDGYGFQPHIIKEAVRDQVDVIFTVDNGISSYQAIEEAKAAGIQVVVCDHHTIPKQLPPADAILHPKLDQSEYPFKELTGVGVAFKFAQAACTRLLPSLEAEKFLKWSLDLVAIGTVADCAPITDENRVLVKYGLLVIEKTRRPGLRNILNLCVGNKPVYDSTLIGFRIAPRINAAGRISHPDSSLKLLITTNVLEADLLAQELQDLNTRRQEKTLQAVKQAKESLEAEIEHEKILIAKHKDWHPGIVGLIAGRLTEEFQRPSIIFHERPDGVLVASARSTEQFMLVDALGEHQDLLLRFGGHAQAAGCSLKREHYEIFCQRMKAYANAILDDDALYPMLKIDCELNIDQMTLDFKRRLNALEPHGIGNPRPLFLIRNLKISRLNPVGKGGAHLQIWFSHQKDTVKGIAFQQGHLARQLSMGETVHIACYLQENFWNGKTSLQLEVVDIQRSGPALKADTPW